MGLRVSVLTHVTQSNNNIHGKQYNTMKNSTILYPH